jgi:hypothetical protein
MNIKNLVCLSFLLCGAHAFAQDSSCTVHVGSASVDASQVTKAWGCATDPRGVHPAVCITTKSEPDKTRRIAAASSKEADDSAKAVSDRAQQCGN